MVVYGELGRRGVEGRIYQGRERVWCAQRGEGRSQRWKGRDGRRAGEAGKAS